LSCFPSKRRVYFFKNLPVSKSGEKSPDAPRKRDASTLMEIITAHVRIGSIIVTDCWKGYSKLNLLGYEHKVVNHSRVFVNEEGFHTNNIEGTWSSIKKCIS
jgi:ISXO2-like transposase domain